MGLLDFANDPLTALGMGLLSASGPSQMPVSVGQAMGAGYGAFQQAQDANARRRMAAIQERAIQEQMDERARQRAAIDSMVGALPENLRPLVQAFPQVAVQQMMREPAAPQLVEVEDPANPGRTIKQWMRPGEAQGVPVGSVPGKLPEGMRLGSSGQLEPIPGYLEMRERIARAGRPPAAQTPYFTPIPTPTGIVAFDNRRGTVAPVTIGGGAVVKSSDDPELQGKIAEAEKLGAKTGEQKSLIQGKYDALNSVKKASKILNSGIYTGAYANIKKSAAKLIPGVDTDKAERTEEFLAYIGNTVVPRLQEFGGNDSNEELRYLRGIMGGDITMEDQALKNILADSERKIKAGIARLESADIRDTGGNRETFDSMPFPSQFKGRRLRGSDGATYRSNGMQWVKE